MEQSPLYQQSENNQPKDGGTQAFTKTLGFRVLCVALAVIIALLVGFGGYAVYYFTQDPAERTLNWVKDVVKNQYYYEFEEDVLENATLDDLFGEGENRLMDIYSAYYTADEYRTQVQEYQGSRSGIGISLLSTSENTQIYRVAGNSPAEKSGLKAGMYLLGYGKDSQSVTPYTTMDALDVFLSGIADGERFVLRAGVTPTATGSDFEVYKAVYEESYVFYADNSLSARYVGENADALQKTAGGISYLPSDTAYVQLSSFMGDAGAQFEGVMNLFLSQGKTDLILDLRNNGGGLNTVLAQIAQFLCKDAGDGNFSVLSAKYRSGRKEIYTARENRYDTYFKGNSQITVLANANTDSASEALMGSMLDYDTIEYGNIFLAEVDGVARSYGKGIMQSTFPNILTGEAIKLTTATVRWPVSDNCIHDIGILPSNGAIALPMTSYVEYNDTMLKTIAQDYLA